MADTVFDRTERGLGSTNLSVANIVAKTRGNPNEIMKLVMGGQINLTQGLLAKRLSDSVVAEQQKAAAPTTTVLQDSFPQLAPAMGGLQPPAQPQMQAPQGMGPVPPQAPMQAPPGMAEGGLAQLDFAAPDYAGGGIVAFAEGDEIDADDFIRLVERLETGGRGDYDAQGRPITSRAGARYAMQVMPDTARDPGYGIRPARADTAEEYNRVGQDYARMLLSRYGNPTDALVAYNAGPGRADRWIAGGRNPDALPGETRQYLARANRAPTSGGSGAASAAPAAAATAENADIMARIAAIGTPTESDPAAFLTRIREAAPTSTAALEALQARVGKTEDPERARERSELGALFQSIGNVRPGMNPLEALAQGFATSGASMQAAEERGRAQELEQLRVAADLERMRNQMTREEYQLAVQVAQARDNRLDAASARELAARLQVRDTDSRERIELAGHNISMLELAQRGELGREELRIKEEGQIADYEASVYGGGNQPSASDQYLLGRLGSLGLTGPGVAPTAPRSPARSYAEVTGSGGGNTLDFSNLPR